jgi:hypothetical protein
MQGKYKNVILPTRKAGWQIIFAAALLLECSSKQETFVFGALSAIISPLH